MAMRLPLPTLTPRSNTAHRVAVLVAVTARP